jgi:hypothetical protein
MSDLDPFEQLQDAAVRFAELVRSIPPESLDLAASTQGLSIDETIRHVAGEFRSVADAPPGSDSENLETIADQLPDLVDAIQNRFAPLVADLGTGVYGAPAYVISETIVHGDQIACAVGNTTWRTTHDDVMVFWQYGISLLQGLLRPEAANVSETWELLPAGQPESSVVFKIDGGIVSSDPDSEVATTERHVVIVEDAAAHVLEFPMQRRAATDSETALLVSRFTKP